MNPVLAPLTPSTTIVFRDGLGERRRVTDPTGRESVDLWYLNSDLAGVPAVEAAMRDRVGRLAGFRHASVNHVLSVDRVNSGATLAVISESAPGVRLSDLLAAAEKHRLPLDINTALYVIRQFVPAIAALHAHDKEIAHGALAPERVVITPRAQLILVDHAAGSGLEHLKFSHQRYWKDLRVALPRSAGLPHFDHRVDVMQMGVVALSLILGRLLHDDEYPTKLPELVGSAWAISDAGDLQPLPPGMRAWLSRALQIDLRHAFTTAAQATPNSTGCCRRTGTPPSPPASNVFSPVITSTSRRNSRRRRRRQRQSLRPPRCVSSGLSKQRPPRHERRIHFLESSPRQKSRRLVPPPRPRRFVTWRPVRSSKPHRLAMSSKCRDRAWSSPSTALM